MNYQVSDLNIHFADCSDVKFSFATTGTEIGANPLIFIGSVENKGNRVHTIAFFKLISLEIKKIKANKAI